MKFNFIPRKVLLGLFLALWLGNSHAQAQTQKDVFSYTSQGKVYLKVSNKLIIHFVQGTSAAQKAAIVDKEAGTLASYADAIHVDSKNFAIVDILDTESAQKSKDLIARLQANPEVRYAAPVLKYEDGTEQAVYGEFYIKAKPGTSYADIQILAAQHKATIVEHYEYDPQVYFLGVDKNSSGNAVDVANAFHETGKFEYAEPNYYYMWRPHNVTKNISSVRKTETVAGSQFLLNALNLPEVPKQVTVTPAPEYFKAPKDVTGTKGTKATRNDTYYPFQWAINNRGGIGGAGSNYPMYPGTTFTADADMDVDDAWDLLPTAGQGVRVAIIDEGVQLNHPDMNVVPGFDSGNFPNNALQGAPQNPVAGASAHGTNCAGIVGARGNNNLGIVGVAHDAVIVPVNIFSGVGANATVVTRGIDWAWNQGQADVLSNSYGGGTPSTLMQDAIRRATTQGRGGKGAPCLFSAGNTEVPQVAYPSRWPEAISVGGSTPTDVRKSSRDGVADPIGGTGGYNYGIGLDVSAPCVLIYSTDITGATGYTPANQPAAPYPTMPSSDYFPYFNGTSSACPDAAGAMALIIAADPTLTYTEARAILEGSTDKVGGYDYQCDVPDQPASSWSMDMGYGRVNARNAVAAALKQYCSSATPRIITAGRGYFEDGSFARDYSNNTDCRWVLQPYGAGTVTLNFKRFNVAQGDTLFAYDGTGVNANVIARATGASIPNPIVSTTGVLVLRFVTNGTGTAPGWQACYTTDAPQATISTNKAVACLNDAVIYTSTASGAILGYTWDFGQGATPATAIGPGPHTVRYSTTGSKTVTLTLRGPGGDVVVTSRNIVKVLAPRTANTINEGFETVNVPDVTLVDEGTVGSAWQIVSYTNPANLLGGFAQSPRAAYFNNWDDSNVGAEDHIILPPLNFANIANPTLTFDVAHSPYQSLSPPTNDRLRVQYSTDCGTTWTTVYLRGGNTTPSLATTATSTAAFFPNNCSQWRKEYVNLNQLTGLNNVLIRFTNITDFGNNTFLDNIAISTNAVPTNLVARAVSGSQIDLNWTLVTANFGVVIERSLLPNTGFVQVGTVGANVTTYSDMTVGSQTTYYYRIAALDAQSVQTPYIGQCPASATTLPGGPVTDIWVENFSGCTGTTPPAGWTNTTITGTAADIWRFNPGPMETAQNKNMRAPFAGCYASFDSDRFSNNNTAENVALTSPAITAAGVSTVFVAFDHFFRGGAGGLGIVEVFDGAAWVTVRTYTATTGGAVVTLPNLNTPGSEMIDISQHVGNKNTGRVRFRWSGDWAWWWAVDNVRVFSVPVAAPSNLTAVIATPTQVNLSWRDNSTNETAFEIERSATSATAGFTLIGTIPGIAGTGVRTNAYLDNTVAANGCYWYRVRAMNGATASIYTNVAAVNLLTAPNGLTATATSTSQINLAWGYTGTGATGFSIERSLYPNYGFAVVGTVTSGTARTYSDTGLQENTTYYYRVRATATCASNYSNIASATTLTAAPSNLMAMATGDDRIALNWTLTSSSHLGVRVQRSATGAANTFATVITLAPGSTSYVDGNLEPDTRYFYRVGTLNTVAFNAAITPIYSNTADALTYPAPPVNPRADAVLTANARIDLSWVDVSTTELGYIVERSSTLRGTYTQIGTVNTNVTTFSDTQGLVGGTQYFYRIRAFREAGVFSRYSTVASTVTFPQAPQMLTATAHLNLGIALAWEDRSASEISYELERSLSPNGPFTRLVTLAPNATSYIDLTVDFLTPYYYRVRANEGAFFSAYSNVANAMRLPLPATNLTAAPFRNAGVQLNWVDNSTSETGFEVERSTAPTGGFARIATLGANVTAFVDSTNVQYHTQYYYRVRATENVIGATDYTNVANATLIQAPSMLTARHYFNRGIALNWRDNSTTESAYQLERSTSATGGFTRIATLAANTVSYVDSTNVQPLIPYYYRVRAVENGFNSTYTNVASAARIPAPSNLTARVFNAQGIRLEWRDNSATEIAYEVERSTSATGPFTLIKTVAANTNSYLDALGSSSIVRYFYRVRAIETDFSSEYTNVASAQTIITTPNAPINLRGTPGYNSAMLTWDAIGDPNLTEYAVYGFSLNSPNILYGTTTNTSFKVQGLVNGTTYIFRVKALGKGGLESDWSNSYEIRPSVVLNSEDESLNNALNAYPNPTAGSFRVVFDAANAGGTLKVAITTVTGQVVYSQKVDNFAGSYAKDIDLGSAASGMYIITVETEKGIAKKKLTITR